MRFVTRSKRGGVPASSRGSKISCWAAIRVYRDGLLRELLLAEWDLLRRHEQPIELKTYRERFVQNSAACCGVVACLARCRGTRPYLWGGPVSFANGRYHFAVALG